MSTANDEALEEKNVLFVGCRDSVKYRFIVQVDIGSFINFFPFKKGKSSIILRYTDRGNEIPKPTIALDYTFCRKAKSGSNVVNKTCSVELFEKIGFILSLQF